MRGEGETERRVGHSRLTSGSPIEPLQSATLFRAKSKYSTHKLKAEVIIPVFSICYSEDRGSELYQS